jgi:hypothetical protein
MFLVCNEISNAGSNSFNLQPAIGNSMSDMI